MGRTKIMAGALVAAATLFLALTQVTSQPSRIHEQLSSEELRHIFHVDHPALVPEYHVVQLTHHLSRRHIPSSHPVNHLNHGPSKVPHEKTNPTKAGNKYRSPSLLNDEMIYNPKFKLTDVDIFGELSDELPIVIGDGSVESETKNRTAEMEPKTTGNGSAVSDTRESGSDNKVSQSASEHDLSDREHVSETQEDGTHRINMEVFGKQLELVLKKQDSLLKKKGLKMWSAVSNDTHPHGVEYVEMHSDDDEEIGELFQDEKSGAALLIRREPKNGKLLVDGSIGHELVIKPLPVSVTAPPEDDEMFLEPGAMADMVSIDTGLPIRRAETERDRLRRALAGANHVIYRRTPKQTEDEMSDYAFMEPDHLAKRYRRRRSAEATEEAHSRSKREAPYVIYPEILVIVDYDGYRLHGGDNVQIKRYFVSFWNGVDLRYKLLKGPRIRISIAGIIISRGRDATPYLERNRVGRDAIDSAAALTDMGKYLFRERKLPVYDIAVAITKLDMCRRQFANDACNRGTAGFAYVGGACVVNKRLEKVNSVAIIEDTGGFSGIIVAAHEVGHLLGAVHDGSPPPSYLGGPGAEKCRWEDGFIMSDLRHTEKGFRWSSCSVQSFHHFLNGDTATCLYNSPHEDDSLPRVLPGRLLTLDAQCRKDRGTSACFKDERVCAQLFCFDASSGYCVAYRPAAEGSPCGDGQYCINGRCIAEHENIIPDYSQHTPSYVRRDTSPFYGTNATSYEETTQPYQENEPSYSSTPNYYNYNAYQTSSTAAPQTYTYYTKPATNIYQTSSQPQTKINPFKYFYQTQSTTKNPYDFRNYNSPVETQSTSYPASPASTQRTFVYNKYSITSTKSPYNFNDFATTKKVKPFKPNEVTADKFAFNEKTSEKPKIFEFYNKYGFNSIFNRTTTKNPYNFAFDSKFRSNNNNIKPLYKIGTYYSQQKDENSVGPDASIRRSVEIEPARLVYSFQTNATALLSSRSHRTSEIAAATNGK